jgi:ribosomal protein L10
VAQIINELPNLTAAELQAVRKKLMEIAAENSAVVLHDRGIDEVHAADLRSRLKTFAEDWERPEAAIYDEDQTR